MTYAAARHRELDRQCARAMGDAPGHALLRSRDRMKDMRAMARARVLLTTLSIRTTAKGRPYLSGWLGRSRVVALAGEPDRFGNATWNIFLTEPRHGPPAARQGAPDADATRAGTAAPATAGACPRGSYSPRRPEPGCTADLPSPATPARKDSTTAI